MHVRDAEKLLEDVEVVPLFETALAEAKRIQERCLEEDIPVLLAGCACGKGCAPRAQVVAREEDVKRVAELLRTEWKEMALREGTFEPVEAGAAVAADPDGEPPCPACGCTRPLEDGACPECGLALA